MFSFAFVIEHLLISDEPCDFLFHVCDIIDILFVMHNKPKP